MVNNDLNKKTEDVKINRGKSGIFGRRSKLFIIAFMIFPIVQFIVFFVIVNYRSVVMAFSDANGTFDCGESNFLFFLKEWQSTERPIQISLKNTLIYFLISNFINLPLVVVFAYLLFKKYAIPNNIKIIKGHK